MRLRDWAQGSSVFLAVIVAGYVSTSYVDQRFASIGTHAPANGPAPTACVGEDRSGRLLFIHVRSPLDALPWQMSVATILLWILALLIEPHGYLDFGRANLWIAVAAVVVLGTVAYFGQRWLRRPSCAMW